MKGKYSNIEIAGMAVAVPEKKSNNDIYTKILGERRVRKQGKLTGIMQTHVSPLEQRTSDLCYVAAKRIMEHLNWEPNEIDVLIFASQTPNYMLPSTAFYIQKRLGIGEDCLVYDINMGCSAFNVGVQAAASHLTTMKSGAKALVLAGDNCVEFCDERSFEVDTLKNLMLFGSAGSATAVQTVRNDSYFRFLLKSKGEKYSSIIRFPDRPTEMEGNCVLDFAINEVSDDLQIFRRELETESKEIDFYVLHQAQKLIVDSIVDTCNLDENKVLNSYSEFGNTSGASIPLSLCVNRDRFENKEYIRTLMSGFGVGLSWTILFTNISTSGILPVIFTDEHYDEDKRARNSLWNRTLIFMGTDDEVCLSAYERINAYSLERAIAIGTNTELLKEISAVSICPNTILKVNRPDIHEAVERLEQTGLHADGVVISLTQYSVDDVIFFVNYMEERNLFKCRYPGIVLLDEYGAIIDKEQILERCFAGFINQSIRVNMVMCHKDNLKYVRKLGRESEWIEEYIDSDFDLRMIRGVDIGNIIYLLLSAGIYFINKSVFKIDEDIKSNEFIS